MGYNNLKIKMHSKVDRVIVSNLCMPARHELVSTGSAEHYNESPCLHRCRRCGWPFSCISSRCSQNIVIMYPRGNVIILTVLISYRIHSCCFNREGVSAYSELLTGSSGMMHGQQYMSFFHTHHLPRETVFSHTMWSQLIADLLKSTPHHSPSTRHVDNGNLPGL